MKLATFRTADGIERVGAVVSDDVVVDLSAADSSLFADMLSLIGSGKQGLEAAAFHATRAASVHRLGEIRLMAPIPKPPRLRDFLCYEKHFRQSRANRHLFGVGSTRLDPASVELPAVWYRAPVYYKCNCHSVVGTGDDVHWPAYSNIIDYEFELGIVVGRAGVDVPPQSALEHVFGYTIFNDFSARDTQYVEMSAGFGPSKGKDFDTGNAIGPWIVTADELPGLADVELVTRVNGVIWARGSTAEMHHGVRDVVSYASQGETLVPGEIFGTGTVGDGCGNELGRFLKHGDVVELEAAGIGVLRNRIVAPHVREVPVLPCRIEFDRSPTAQPGRADTR